MDKRIEFAKLTVPAIDFMWPSVLVIAKGDLDESLKVAGLASK